VPDLETRHYDMKEQNVKKLTRREFIKLGAVGGLATGGLLALKKAPASADAWKALAAPTPQPTGGMSGMDMSGMDGTVFTASPHAMLMPGVNGEVDHAANGFNPTDILTDFDYGVASTLPDGRTLREYHIAAIDKSIEISPGITFPAWVYNGRIPGPTLRVREGDRVRIRFGNGSAHPHTMHFHGIHPGNMDGVFELVQTGESFTYEFDAEPFGVHLYHCHSSPLAKHIAKGLYGAFIIDPKEGWPKVDHEFVMVMHGYDIDFDDQNDFYAVNGIPFHYSINPIKIKTGESVRIFLVNILEFDPINSFHLHANFFNYYPTGTSRTPSEYTDMIAQMQGQRGMLEFTYKYPGRYMFHAHKTEFADLGWMGLFEVEEA
jgi:FtsP/CotA-like multicopper oxidase with cupredoxin domain